MRLYDEGQRFVVQSPHSIFPGANIQEKTTEIYSKLVS